MKNGILKKKVPYSYLNRQFENPERYFSAIQSVISQGDFTLGKVLTKLENRIANVCKTSYAIGVNSGTDALFLILKTLNIGPGDEVLTAPNSFIATSGVIVQAGATPVFVDVKEDYTMNPDLIEERITSKTKALLPVHLTGCPADMPAILNIANRHGLFVIEDAAQAIGAKLSGQPVGSFGVAAGFSFHPLKNINGWGDGGIITTCSSELNEKIRLLRNHGLKTRDECAVFGYNSRLDTIQAAILLELLDELPTIIAKRNALASLYDQELSALKEDIVVPPRRSEVHQVFHTYVIQAKKRDALKSYLESHGVEAKVHYPIPIHLQEAAKCYSYKKGDFPVCESQAAHILTLPLHQHLDKEDILYVCEVVKTFYSSK